MAYAAVVSLKHTIQRLIESSQIPIPPLSPQIIQLACEDVKSLQQVFTLEDGSNNERVKAVEREIRDAACRLEDVLEQAHLSNHYQFLSQPHETLDGDFSVQVKEEIIFFTETVKKIKEQLGNGSLPEEEEEEDVLVSSRIDQYFGLKKPKIIGLTDELFRIRNSITHYPYEDPERLIVLAMEGMAGIGKTALVTAVYLDPRILSHFQCRAFVSIGPTKCQLRRILLCIIAQTNSGFDTSGNAEISDHDEDLTSYLYSCLKNRRYLIVVDDVWNVQVWDELKKAFPDDRNKSRVIVTTRLYNIAKHASSTISWETKRFLNEEESWHLLRGKIVVEEGVTLPEDSSTSSSTEKGKLEIKKAKDSEALYYIQTAVADHIFPRISVATSAKEAWSILQKEYQGSAKNSNRKEENSKSTMGDKKKPSRGKYMPCRICKRTNHLEKDCYFRGKPQCRNCKKFGHVEKDCRLKGNHLANCIKENHSSDQLFYTCNSVAETGDATWYIDSAASNHMTYNKGAFQKLDESFKTNVKLGDNHIVKVEGKGSVAINIRKGTRIINDVMYIPNLRTNLFSVGQMMEKGYTLQFGGDSCTIYDNKDKTLIIAK
ncbi:UNVERIFIED_CONTAM: putative late blight resistance proteinR1A-4 [Sesamum radiatum]|uniref:Late blight resistance proteinR1A-4 n=1 Tax=Sesamum radiatum TaxID=300843 RepID=A0AAW2RYC1_SESRA